MFKFQFDRACFYRVEANAKFGVSNSIVYSSSTQTQHNITGKSVRALLFFEMTVCVFYHRRIPSIASDSGDERETRSTFTGEAGANKSRKLLFKKKVIKVCLSH